MGEYISQNFHKKGIDVHVGIQKDEDLNRCFDVRFHPSAIKYLMIEKEAKKIGTSNTISHLSK